MSFFLSVCSGHKLSRALNSSSSSVSGLRYLLGLSQLSSSERRSLNYFVLFVRAGAYVVAQSGGAIAGASVVLGLYGNTGEAELSLSHGPGHRSTGLAQFGLEFLLAFMIVLAYLRVTDESQVSLV